MTGLAVSRERRNLIQTIRRVGAGVAALAIALTGCSGGTGGGSTSADATGTYTPERAGGRVTMGTFAEPRGLDPVGQPGSAVTGGTEITALYDTLVDWNAKESRYEPRVAESLQPDASFVTW